MNDGSDTPLAGSKFNSGTRQRFHRYRPGYPPLFLSDTAKLQGTA